MARRPSSYYTLAQLRADLSDRYGRGAECFRDGAGVIIVIWPEKGKRARRKRSFASARAARETLDLNERKG